MEKQVPIFHLLGKVHGDYAAAIGGIDGRYGVVAGGIAHTGGSGHLLPQVAKVRTGNGCAIGPLCGRGDNVAHPLRHAFWSGDLRGGFEDIGVPLPVVERRGQHQFCNLVDQLGVIGH